MALFTGGPSENNLFDFRVGVLCLRPAPADRPSDAVEGGIEVDFAGAVIGEAEDTPLRGNGGTGEDGGFEGPEKGSFAETSDLTVNEYCPLLGRSMTTEKCPYCA